MNTRTKNIIALTAIVAVFALAYLFLGGGLQKLRDGSGKPIILEFFHEFGCGISPAVDCLSGAGYTTEPRRSYAPSRDVAKTTSFAVSPAGAICQNRAASLGFTNSR